MQARSKPFTDHSFASEEVFEGICLHLILSDYLDAENLARLNSLSMLFEHMCKIAKHTKLWCIYKLFEYDKDYASQEKSYSRGKGNFYS